MDKLQQTIQFSEHNVMDVTYENTREIATAIRLNDMSISFTIHKRRKVTHDRMSSQIVKQKENKLERKRTLLA